MSKRRAPATREKLDKILESYWSLEGTSIKSILSMAAKGTTLPSALTSRDMGAMTFDLLIGLTQDEMNELREYYVWRQIGDRMSTLARAARGEARKRKKRRRFKTGIAEVERKFSGG